MLLLEVFRGQFLLLRRLHIFGAAALDNTLGCCIILLGQLQKDRLQAIDALFHLGRFR